MCGIRTTRWEEPHVQQLAGAHAHPPRQHTVKTPYAGLGPRLASASVRTCRHGSSHQSIIERLAALMSPSTQVSQARD